MFLIFFLQLRTRKIPVTLGEYLDLLSALECGLSDFSVATFHTLSRSILIKHEQFYDAFDRAFDFCFRGIDTLENPLSGTINEEWIKDLLGRTFTEEEKALIESMGGLDAIMARLKELLENQKERHQGGNTWIGTGGTSAFGNGGYNPEGIRIGGKGGGKSAVKIWEQRLYKDYSGQQHLDNRNLKIALRSLRRFTREGAEEILDIPVTLKKTSENAGWLDIQFSREKKNNIKVLMLMDVGGSMGGYVKTCEDLFSAAKTEFKHLEYYYFHNCVYDKVWKNNQLRLSETIPLEEIIHKYNNDYKLIYIGDASMASYEILSIGGAIDFYNEKSGAQCIHQLNHYYKHHIWLNPVNENEWNYFQSVGIIKELMEDKMFPMTIDGIAKAMKQLKTKSKI